MRHNTGYIGGKYLAKQIKEGNVWQNKYRRGKLGKRNIGEKCFVKQI